MSLLADLATNETVAAEALEHSVFEHYPEFIVVSKEISRPSYFLRCSVYLQIALEMERDMIGLRGVLSGFASDIARLQELSIDLEDGLRNTIYISALLTNSAAQERI